MKIRVNEKSGEAALDALVAALGRVKCFRLLSLKAGAHQGDGLEIEVTLDVIGDIPVAISGRYSVGTNSGEAAVRAAEEWVAYSTALPGPRDETWAVSPAFQFQGLWWSFAIVASPKQ